MPSDTRRAAADTHSYETHAVCDAPTPPPPRPPRPQRLCGYVLTAPSTAAAQLQMQQQLFFTRDRQLLQTIRPGQPIILLDAQAQLLHGVFKRDPEFLQQDLTSAPHTQPGYQGPPQYAVHVVPLFAFPVALELDDVDDLLIARRQQPGASSSSQVVEFEPVLGSRQHGALWDAFMKRAKKHKKAMDSIQEVPSSEGADEQEGAGSGSSLAQQQQQAGSFTLLPG